MIMVLIYTKNEDLNNDLHNEIINSKIVYYPEFFFEKHDVLYDTVIISHNVDAKMPLKDFLFKLRSKDMRIIFLAGGINSQYIGYILALGIYDIIFDPFDAKMVANVVANPAKFSDVQHLYLGLREKVSFSGEPIKKENRASEINLDNKDDVMANQANNSLNLAFDISSILKLKSSREEKVLYELPKEDDNNEKITYSVIPMDCDKEERALKQLSGIMKLLGSKMKSNDINEAILELEQSIIDVVI